MASKDSSTVMTTSALFSFTCCSMGMMVFNKLAVESFPLPCMLIVLQMVFTVFVMLTICRDSVHIGSLHDVRRWSAVIPFFVGMLLTSIFALQDAPMSLVITFRALTPWLTMAAERFFPNPSSYGIRSKTALLLMLSGVGLYTTGLKPNDAKEWSAVGWVALNSLMAVAERLLQRLMLSADQAPVDISKTGISLINNAIGLLPMLLVAILTKEHMQLKTVVIGMGKLDILWVVCSCIVGVGISFTAIWMQSLISATSMLVLTNANKFLVIMLELFVMPDKSIITLQQTVGALTTVVATLFYAQARNYENEQGRKQEQIPLVQKKG